ncbi:MAG: hypothetical protein GWN99_18095, partial [Gemmatimonadetes bacterium]|nr:hypothetical protein [Gemmatimonadota bacterium]NIS02947.1 hypothetical protein [Gemmatimonadota bacterium]NIT67732.1 hypothetical protein [Gemmatimonadota bacterium]NIU51632.1 hypothetical protein [Gemmatimonadota bacterium]NIV25346.1 hypothetical protein [Gemmatimonadota bacterium]
TLLYVGQSGRPYSYVYADDVNGDGYPGAGRLLDHTNDLIYVPYGPSDIPGGIATQSLVEGLVRLEDCLRSARGAIVGRNACRTPWTDRLDLRLAQTFRVGRGG